MSSYPGDERAAAEQSEKTATWLKLKALAEVEEGDVIAEASAFDDHRCDDCRQPASALLTFHWSKKALCDSCAVKAKTEREDAAAERERARVEGLSLDGSVSRARGQLLSLDVALAEGRERSAYGALEACVRALVDAVEAMAHRAKGGPVAPPPVPAKPTLLADATDEELEARFNVAYSRACEDGFHVSAREEGYRALHDLGSEHANQGHNALLDEVSRVYEHVTGGMCCAPNTSADAVIALANDELHKTVESQLTAIRALLPSELTVDCGNTEDAVAKYVAATKAPGALTAERLDQLEKNCMATYMGGHDGEKLEAFIHGMGTVFNVLRAGIQAVERSAEERPRVADQPAPVPTSGVPIWELVIADMKERDRLGRERYGTPLQAGNGRKTLVDAYQEVLDLSAYLRQEIEERDARGEHTISDSEMVDKLVQSGWVIVDGLWFQGQHGRAGYGSTEQAYSVMRGSQATNAPEPAAKEPTEAEMAAELRREGWQGTHSGWHPVATGGPSHRVLRDAYAAMRAAKEALATSRREARVLTTEEMEADLRAAKWEGLEPYGWRRGPWDDWYATGKAWELMRADQRREAKLIARDGRKA